MTTKAKALRGFLGSEGRVRRGAIIDIDQGEFDRLKALGLVAVPKNEPVKVDDDLDGRTVDDLLELAKASGVELGEAKKKAEIIAAIRAHRAKA